MPYRPALEKFKKENKRVFQKHAQKTLKDAIDRKSDDIFRSAVDAAYRDAARTFTGIGSNAKEKETALKIFATAVRTYFDLPANAANFDKTHNTWCEQLISNFKPYEITYGQAQKIVNMTFKYLYCLDDSASYQAHFEHCHVALDSFTLEWIWRNCDTKKHNKYEAWSTLRENSYSSKGIKRPGYKDILDIYRDPTKGIREKYPGITPFQAEFIFWPEIQMELSAEAFLKQLEEYMDSAHKKKIENMKLLEKLKEIIKKAVDFI